MKKSRFFSAGLALLALLFFSCSVSSNDDNNGESLLPSGTSSSVEAGGDDSPKVTSNLVSEKSCWIFSDLASLSCQAVNAETALASSSELAAATTSYSSFSAIDKKFSLKADVSYASANKKYAALIKALDSDGKTPIQYCGYDSKCNKCKESDHTAGALQIKGDAFVIDSIQGPFTIKLNYGANSKDGKKDGRYAYVKIGDTVYKDEAVIAANFISQSGTGFSVEYKGNDSTSVTVGSTNWVCLYDVVVSKDIRVTTTVTTKDNEDGSKTVTTTVTDEEGNVISSSTENTATSSGSSTSDTGSSTSDTGSSTSDNDSATTGKQTSSEAVTPTIDNSATAPAYTNGLKVGTRTNISSVNTDSLSTFIYVSPNGTSSGAGTKASPMDLITAITKIPEGGAIVLKGGTYSFSSTVKIAYGNNGSEAARKYILPESGSAAVLDFSAQAVADSSRGVQIDGDWWHIYGINCYNAGDNGMYVTGNNNIVERCVFQANQDTGLQIARRDKNLSNMAYWPSNNLILNCTSFDNKDDKTGENADGFAAKLTCGNGNVFDGCISYANCDDGWDLYAKSATGPIGIVTIRNCVAFQNGKTTSGANYANGDMNGFKLGGSNNSCPTPHVVSNSLAFLNGKDGFTDNGNGGALNVSNCTSYGNINSNFNFYRTYAGGVFTKLVSMAGEVSPAQVDKFGGKKAEVTVAAKISSSIYLTDKKKKTFNYVDAESVIYNGDKAGTTISDIYSTDIKSTKAPQVNLKVDAQCRNTDGTINLGGFLETSSSSKYAGMGARFGDQAETVLECGLK
ncbi:MAG: right-handed parallel beta-helix repeat-containing protein [Treponema sp.]|nr:right-handed parallel beta-helix repeat-containing protein [Treponema sp.]